MLKLAFAVLTYTLTPKLPTRPALRGQAGQYEVINPLRRDIIVTLGCGSDWEPLSLEVHGQSVIRFDVQTPKADDRYPICTEFSWRLK